MLSKKLLTLGLVLVALTLVIQLLKQVSPFALLIFAGFWAYSKGYIQ
ncbi:MAG TPA: hypothetical protein VGC17_08140 [Lactovum miscens]